MNSSYYVYTTDGVLYNSGIRRPQITYYCPFTGNILSDKTLQTAKQNTIAKKYPSTNHALISVQVGGQKVLYVNLDNSGRSMREGFSLTEGCNDFWGGHRLETICSIVKSIQPDIAFFTDACSTSVSNSPVRAQTDPFSGITHWSEIKRVIARRTSLIFGCEQCNMTDSIQESYGVAMFYHEKHSYQKSVILREDCVLLSPDHKYGGSPAIKVTLRSGESIVCVDFPLDLSGRGFENRNYKAMKSLLELIKRYPDTIVIGSMNIFEGNIEESIRKALDSTYWMIARDSYNYFPAFYEMLPDHGDLPCKTIPYNGRVISHLEKPKDIIGCQEKKKENRDVTFEECISSTNFSLIPQ